MMFKDIGQEDIPHILTPEEILVEKYLSIPTLIIPVAGEDNQESLEQQFDRAIATRLFIAGKIDFDEYLDILHYTGINIGNVIDFWENGISLSPSFRRQNAEF